MRIPETKPELEALVLVAGHARVTTLCRVTTKLADLARRRRMVQSRKVISVRLAHWAVEV